MNNDVREFVLSYKEISGHIVKLLRIFHVSRDEYEYKLTIDNKTMTKLTTFRKLERKDFVDTLTSINENNICLFLGKFNL